MLFVLAIVLYLSTLCVLVVVQNPKKLVNISLSVSIMSIALWLVSVYGLQSDFGRSVVYARFVFTFGFWGVASLVWFLYELLKDYNVNLIGRKGLISYFACIISFGTLMAATPFVISSVRVEDGRLPVPAYGVALTPFILLILVTLFIVVALLVHGYQRTSGIMRKQVSTVAISVTASVGIALLTNLIIPQILGNTQTALLTPLPVGVLLTGLSYSIIKHKLLNFRRYLVRAVTYIVVAGVLAVLYIAPVIFLMAKVLDLEIHAGAYIIVVLIGTIAATNYHRVSLRFNKISNRVFFQDAYDSGEVLNLLNVTLISSANLREMLTNTATLIEKSLRPEYGMFITFDSNGAERRYLGHDSVIPADFSVNETLNAVSHIKDGVIFTESLSGSNESTRQTLQASEVSGIIKIVAGKGRNKKILSYLVIGPRKSGKIYDIQDKQFLETVASTLVIAIQNALHYEEIQQFNETLQQKVEEATRKLRVTNEKLKRMDETKDEFISMASHQLRTPLTSVKGYVSMVLEGDVGPINDQQRALLNQSFQSSQRMANLMSDLLNLSRINTGKFVIDATPVNLKDIVVTEFEQLREMADAKNIDFMLDIPAQFPTLNLDDGKMHQVVMNLIDNALYYTAPGGKVNVCLSETPTTIEFRVVDTGIGVPRDAQKFLFSKMYRADNARRARPDGTGLGLFLVKKVIVEQQGAIIFETEEGKGSTFGFRFNKKDHLVPETSVAEAKAATSYN